MTCIQTDELDMRERPCHLKQPATCPTCHIEDALRRREIDRWRRQVTHFPAQLTLKVQLPPEFIPL